MISRSPLTLRVHGFPFECQLVLTGNLSSQQKQIDDRLV